MAITNPITQAKIIAEFGGGYPFVLGNYRRGAGIVPDHSGTAGIPTGYPISFQQFLGASADGATLSNTSQAHTSVAPNNAHAQLGITGSNVVGRTTSTSGPTNIKYAWLLGGSAASFEIRATLASGTGPAGSALNTWINCSTNPQWYLQRNTNGASGCSLTVELRPAGGGATLATAAWGLTATRNP